MEQKRHRAGASGSTSKGRPHLLLVSRVMTPACTG